MIYFTSDTHLSHKFVSALRGYESPEEMNTDMIEIWNNTVSPLDTVYFLGDVSFASTEKTISIFKMLHGTKYLIKGNHDHSNKVKEYKNAEIFQWIKDYYVLKEKMTNDVTQKIVMSHFPMMVWDNGHYGSWHLHGHCHGNLKAPETTRLDIGWDVFNKPVSFDEVFDILSKRKYVSCDHHS